MATAVRDWRTMTPNEVLDAYPALTMTQVAYVCGLTFIRGEKAGQPDRRKALALVADGKLPVIDPTRPVPFWTVSATNVRNYLTPN